MSNLVRKSQAAEQTKKGKVQRASDSILLVPTNKQAAKELEKSREVQRKVSGTIQLLLNEIKNKQSMKSKADEPPFLNQILNEILQDATITKENGKSGNR